MITYTLDTPSGITINGVELVKGDTVKEPRGLVAHLLTRDGWSIAEPKTAPEPEPKPTRKKRTAKDDR